MRNFIFSILSAFLLLNHTTAAELIIENWKPSHDPLTSHNHIPSQVNVVTGDYLDESVDLIVPGCQPLSFRRYHSRKASYDPRYVGWFINPETCAWGNLNLPEYKKDGLHVKMSPFAAVGEPDGSVTKYTNKRDYSFRFDPSKKEGFCYALENGQSHPLNTSIEYWVGARDSKDSDCFSFDGVITDGSGSKRFFTSGLFTWHKPIDYKKKKGFNVTENYRIHPPCWMPYQLKIEEERLPNGNIIRYDYIPFKEYDHLPSFYLLSSIKAYNHDKSILLSQITINYDRDKHDNNVGMTIEGTGGRKAILHTSGRDPIMLERAYFPSEPSLWYHYDHQVYTSKEKPNGYYVTVIYDEQKRVTSLVAPLGPNKEEITLHHYTYRDGSTEALDTLGNLVIYRYDSNKRITTIESYQGDSLVRVERNGWDAATGNLISKSFENGHGIICLKTEYCYDKRQNVIQETVSDGKESYTVSRTFNDFNLKTSETDGFGKTTQYEYVPNTNLLSSELDFENASIKKRQFYFYDDTVTNICVKTITDDGCTKDPDDLTNVTHRLVKYIQPKRTSPCFGLPEIVEEKTLDPSHREILLHKIMFEYAPSGQITKEHHFDATGKFQYTLSNEYDSRERLACQTNALGYKTFYKYNVNNKCTQQIDLRGFTTSWEYDIADNPISENDGIITYTSYDYLGQAISKTDPSGHITHFTYDALGRLIQTIHPDRGTEKKEYDALSRVIKEIDPRGYETSYSYHLSGKPSLIQHPDGTQEHFVYHPNGTLLQYTNKNGTKTVYTYDVYQRPIKEETYDPSGKLLKAASTTYNAFHKLSETDPEGITTHYTYDFAGRKVCEKTLDKETLYTYDSLGHLCRTQKGDTIQCEDYDLLDRLIEKRIEDASGHIFFQENYRYDASGNLTHTITCQGISETVYNAQNLPITQITSDGQVTKINHDYKECYTKTLVDPLGVVKQEKHDSCNRLQDIRVKTSEGQVIQERSFEYDQAGNQIKATDWVYSGPELSRIIVNAWEYGPLNRLEKQIESGIKETRNIYDSQGRLQIIIKPDSTELHHIYDSLGRLARLTSKDIDYQYTYNKNDQVTQVFDAIQKTTTLKNYDLYGNLIEETLGNGIILKSTYDPYHKRLALTYPDRSQATFTYQAGCLSRISYNNLTYTYQSRNLATKPTEITFPKGSLHLEYDSTLRLKSIQGPSYSANAYTYDPKGNLLSYSLRDSIGEIEWHYTYDSLNQLTSENAHTYAYDSFYNRTAKDDQPYNLNNLSQITSNGSTTFEYDSNGNLIKVGNTRLLYDSLDRLIEVQKEGNSYHYLYDPFNRRLTKKTPHETIHYYWDGQNEIGSSKQEIRVLGEGLGAEIGAAVFVKLGKEVFIPIHDHRGAIVTLLNAEAKPYETIRYTAFGEETIQTIKCPWRFASKRFDPETGYIYFGRRYYSPDLGRWITTDPNGFEDGPNLYAYVKNCPHQAIDLYGEWAFWQNFKTSMLKTFEFNFPFTYDLCNLPADAPSWQYALLASGTVLEIASVAFPPARGVLPLAERSIYQIVKYAANRTANNTLLKQSGKASVIALEKKVAGNVLKKGGKTAIYSPDFIVSPSGITFPVPKGARGPIDVINKAGKKTGSAFIGGKGGSNQSVSNMRLMNPTSPKGRSPGYPKGYIKYENKNGQGVNPYTGRTLAEEESHFTLE